MPVVDFILLDVFVAICIVVVKVSVVDIVNLDVVVDENLQVSVLNGVFVCRLTSCHFINLLWSGPLVNRPGCRSVRTSL